MEDIEVSNTCKARYERLVTERRHFLDRARQCAELTIPTLIPPEGHTSTTVFKTPWQSVGSRGVNNLSSKMLLTLFPPNTPMFRLQIDDKTMEKLGAQPEERAKIEAGLNKIERAAMREMENGGMRPPIFLAFKHLLVGGNTLIVIPDDDNEDRIRIFPLDSYVVVRDASGNLLEVIVRELINPDILPAEVEAQIEEESITAELRERKSEMDEKARHTPDEDIEVYTRYYLDDDRWYSYQEIKDVIIEGTEADWPKDKAPILALRWSHVAGEDYGRSYVEEYAGDLITLEALSKAIAEGSAAMAKVVYLVNPNGVTLAEDITSAESGDAITGHENDVSCLQADKRADLQVAQEMIKTLTERLSYAFLLQSAVQRNGDRVTAEEIRYMAGELEDALGGVYSVMSQEFQLPFVRRLLDKMERQKKLPKLPKDILTPVIVTGLDALGRGHDLNKYKVLLQMIKDSGLGEAIVPKLNIDNLITRLGTALMIDMDGLIKTDEQFAQEQQQAQQQRMQQQMLDMAGKAAPAAVKAMSDQMTAVQQSPTEPQAPPAAQ